MGCTCALLDASNPGPALSTITTWMERARGWRLPPRVLVDQVNRCLMPALTYKCLFLGKAHLEKVEKHLWSSIADVCHLSPTTPLAARLATTAHGGLNLQRLHLKVAQCQIKEASLHLAGLGHPVIEHLLKQCLHTPRNQLLQLLGHAADALG